MDNFRVIYRILKAFEAAMDCDEFDEDMISPERLKISENRWAALMEELVANGYLKGISIQRSADGQTVVSMPHPAITIRGLEYLEDNTFMKKAARVAKGIKDTIPGL